MSNSNLPDESFRPRVAVKLSEVNRKMLVFFMNAGFCMLETGFCRQKNAVNVLAKNLIVFALSSIAFWIIGFGLMFSNDAGHGFIGTSGGFFLSGADNSPATGDAYNGIFSSLNWTGVPPKMRQGGGHYNRGGHIEP